MITKVVGHIVDQYSQDWDMDGKKGTTQRISIYVGKGKFENVAVAPEVAPFYKDKVGDDIELECDVFIKKNGSYNLKACIE
jgi:hypothetical protein